MKKQIVMAALLAAGSVTGAMAQASGESPWLLRVRSVHLDSVNKDSTPLGLAINNKTFGEVDITYFLSRNVAAELVLTYPQQVNITAGSGNTNIGKVTALPPSLLVQYHFTELGAFKPYVGVGVNYTIFGNRQNFPALGNSVTVDQSSLGAVAQIGADYMFDKNWGLNLDVKYATMSTNVTTVQGGTNLGKLALNPWMPAVGVTYKF